MSFHFSLNLLGSVLNPVDTESRTLVDAAGEDNDDDFAG